MAYWKMKPFLGCGPGAVSTLPGANGSVWRFENIRDISGFLAGEESFWNMEPVSISPSEFLLEYLMMGLRLSDGIGSADFLELFHDEPAGFIPNTVSRWKKRKLLVVEEDRFFLNGKGRLFLNAFLRDAAAEIDAAQVGFSISWAYNKKE